MGADTTNHMGLRPHVSLWKTSRFDLDLKRPQVMGIVNLTPDSFSDGGRFDSAVSGLRHAEQLLHDGADILDIGGESSRPGAPPLGDEQEWARIELVLREVVQWQVPISVDSYRPTTMQRALDLGVDIINDIWALRQPGALDCVSRYKCGICLMHMHGQPQTMQQAPMHGQAIPEVLAFLRQRLDVLLTAGVSADRVCLDPGVGFGKTVDQNFELLREQATLLALGQPLLVGWSRKSALGAVTGRETDRRMVPSVAAALLAIERGAHVVRVHDVADTVSALQVWQASRQA